MGPSRNRECICCHSKWDENVSGANQGVGSGRRKMRQSAEGMRKIKQCLGAEGLLEKLQWLFLFLLFSGCFKVATWATVFTTDVSEIMFCHNLVPF